MSSGIGSLFSKKNRWILYASTVIGFGAFYFQTIRPGRAKKYNQAQERAADEIFAIRYPELAAARQEKKLSKTEEFKQ